jgi:hypothetical protein|tara:strand:+ start:37083 stop:37469 length:387 start_codon:yes stop_codon:yes gene_type:complete
MAQSEDIMVDQGSDITLRLECFETDGSKKIFKKLDPSSGGTIAPYVATGKIKKSYSTSDSSAISFGTSFLDLDNPNILQLSLSNTITETMKSGRYVYDVELSYQDSATNTTIVERILQGTLTVSPSVN